MLFELSKILFSLLKNCDFGSQIFCCSLLLQKQKCKQLSSHTVIHRKSRRSEAHQSMEIRTLSPHFPVTPSFGLSQSSKTGHLQFFNLTISCWPGLSTPHSFLLPLLLEEKRQRQGDLPHGRQLFYVKHMRGRRRKARGFLARLGKESQEPT